MGGTARTGDDHFNAAALSTGGVFKKKVRRAVSGDHAGFVRNAEFVECFGRGSHRLPVGSRAHDDANQWFHREILSNKPRTVRNSSREAVSRLAGSTRELVAFVIS